MLGVASLIIIISVMNGLEAELKDRVLSTVSHAVITTEQDKIDSDFDYKRFEKLDNVLEIHKEISDEVIIQGPKSISVTKLVGINPNNYPDFDLIKASIGSKNFSYLEQGSYEVSIGEVLAHQLNITVGDKVRIIAPSNVRHTMFGSVPVSRLFTVNSIYYVGTNDAQDGIILANIDDVRKLIGFPKNKVTGFRVWLSDPYKVDEFENKVMDVLVGNNNLKDNQESHSYVVKDWREVKGEFFKSVAFEKMMSSLMLGLIIIVAVFNMMSSLVMVVTSKMSEIAILRTLGMTRRNIVSVFIIEGCISGIVGTILGGILGITLLFNLDQLLSLIGVRLYLSSSGAGIPFDINVMQVAIVMLSTVFFSILITIYPSYRASRINPVEFLRYE